MRVRWADTAVAAPGWLLLPGLAVALLAGMVTAVAGGMAGERALYYVAVFGFIILGSVVALTRAEPLRFVFLALIVCFPIATVLVPPGRIGLTVFDVVMIALTIGLIGKRVPGFSRGGEPLFPTTSLLIAWWLTIPCVVLSQFPAHSLLVFIVTFAAYGFFLFTLDELRRPGGFERLALLWSLVVLILAIGMFVEHFLHIELSFRGSNLNQLTYSSGLEIYRAGGFFQDPQKGAAFNACLIAFLLTLAVRGRFRDMRMRLLVWSAIVVGLASLITTISRAAIMACVLASALALFAFNKWNAAAKLALTAGVIVLLVVMALSPGELWLNIVPAAVTERFANLHQDFEIRREIWFDTWHMFADHPLAGIGLGSFQPYLMATRPTVFNWYGMGDAAGGVMYVPDNAENGYLTILYEGGIVGSIAALLVVGDALRRAIVVIAAHPDSDARTEALAALAALFTFGLTFITLFAMNDRRLLALFAAFLAVIWHRSLPRAQAAPKS